MRNKAKTKKMISRRNLTSSCESVPYKTNEIAQNLHDNNNSSSQCQSLIKLQQFLISSFQDTGRQMLLNWIEQGLTSHQTHYRSYPGQIFTGQMTQPTVSKH